MPLGELMGILGIDTIAIVVSDRRKAIRWYRDVLGLEVAFIGPSVSNTDPRVQGTPDDAGHWIELGPLRPRTRVHLCQMDETEPGPTGITFLTNDILAEYGRMRDAGVEFPMPPEKMEWGEWLGQFVDPDGNVFDLKQPISIEIWKGPATSRGRRSPRLKRAPGAARGRGRVRGRRTRRPRRTAPSS
jgi:catechol 2,3-dioxygenase-like lactoylglutathione lyase family enzyme